MRSLWCGPGFAARVGDKQAALLAYVRRLVPATADVVVIGDSEYTPVQALLEGWGWHYVLRQKGSHLLQLTPDHAWQRCDAFVTQPNDRLWLTNITLTQQHAHHCHFLALWRTGEKEPWLLATNLPTATLTRLHYSRRMWIEGLFGDFKLGTLWVGFHMLERLLTNSLAVSIRLFPCFP